MGIVYRDEIWITIKNMRKKGIIVSQISTQLGNDRNSALFPNALTTKWFKNDSGPRGNKSLTHVSLCGDVHGKI